MSFTLPALDFDPAALSPFLSAESFTYHHGKHHATYVRVLNELTANAELTNDGLEKLILEVTGVDDKKKIFNNAGQHWNHTLFWQSLSPPNSCKPSTSILKLLEQSFGGFDNFAMQFTSAAIGQFGSGWAWLVADKDNKLSIETTANADLPLAKGRHALLTVDVWEHAYYIDKRNDRKGFVEDFITKLANWDNVTRRLDSRANIFEKG